MVDEHAGLKEVLAKLKKINEEDYNGKHYDNALNIFNDLSDRDKKVFLLGVLNIYNMMEATAAVDLGQSSWAPLGGDIPDLPPVPPPLPKPKPKVKPLPKVEVKQEDDEEPLVDLDMDGVPDGKSSKSKDSEFEKANQLELIKLKSWVVKMVVITIAIGFVLMVALSVMLGHTNDSSVLKPLSGISKILSVIIDP